MTRASVIRAEAPITTDSNPPDLVLINQFNSITGQYEPRMVTIANFLATTLTSENKDKEEITVPLKKEEDKKFDLAPSSMEEK